MRDCPGSLVASESDSGLPAARSGVWRGGTRGWVQGPRRVWGGYPDIAGWPAGELLRARSRAGEVECLYRGLAGGALLGRGGAFQLRPCRE